MSVAVGVDGQVSPEVGAAGESGSGEGIVSEGECRNSEGDSSEGTDGEGGGSKGVRSRSQWYGNQKMGDDVVECLLSCKSFSTNSGNLLSVMVSSDAKVYRLELTECTPG